MKNALIVIFKVIFITFAVFFALFYFKLAYFLFLLWPFGALIAILFTQPERKKSKEITANILFVVIFYMVCNILVWKIFTDQKSEEVFEMTWTDKGNTNDLKESEILLQFVDYPTQYVGIYSNELSNYLHHLQTNPVTVTFEVKRDFGCFRSFYQTQIEDLKHWKSPNGYFQSAGNADPRLWKDPSWCNLF